VSPTEAYSTLNESDRLAEIARLQQRTRALEAELAYRREVEAALLAVIAHRRRLDSREVVLPIVPTQHSDTAVES
jgi:hypothetical protein